MKVVSNNTNVIKLDNDWPTYKEAILAHLDSRTEEDNNRPVQELVIAALAIDGSYLYTDILDADLHVMLGILDVVKAYFISEYDFLTLDD